MVWVVIAIGIIVALVAATLLALQVRRLANEAQQVAAEFDEVSRTARRVAAAAGVVQTPSTDGYNSSEEPGTLPGK